MAIKTGTNSSETLTGTNDNDQIDGKGGNDTLKGLLGNDDYIFSGNFGNDTVVEASASGNDTLRLLSDIPAAAVRLYGDSADDLYIIADGFGSVRLADHLLGARVEALQIGSAFAISLTGGLTMTGSANSNSMYGTKFNDTINGKGGNDTLYGGVGDDIYDFSGNFGNDTVVEASASGNDTLRLLSDIPAAAVRLYGDSADDLYIIADGFGSVRLADHLLGARVEALQIGSAAAISLTGGLTMTGSANSNSMYGTKFNDTINGKEGNDTLYGGVGQDNFVFEGNFGSDKVSDFSQSQMDRLDFSQIDANSSLAGDQSFSFIGTEAFTSSGGEIRYFTSGSNRGSKSNGKKTYVSVQYQSKDVLILESVDN